MKKKKEMLPLGKDIENQVAHLSCYPNEVLAAALLFVLTNDSEEYPESDEDFNNIVSNAGKKALSLADEINILYNTQKETRH